MDEEKRKQQIGRNIASCRRRAGLTQADLGNQLGYSDKTVSKWERGESLPDVLTLSSAARILGVSVEVLVEGLDLPQTHLTVHRKFNRNIILALAGLLPWFLALLCHVILDSFGISGGWLSYSVALPVCALVILCIRCAWKDFRQNRLLISLMVWGCLLSVHLFLLVLLQINLWKIYLLGFPSQLAICLWFRLYCPSKGE